MPVADVNGVEINYTDSGGQGPVVVFSHGFLMDQTMFDRQVAVLAPDYRVIGWDQRGHGGTLAAVKGAAHASNVTHPDEVNQALLGFLSGLEQGR
jgi:pimeloyl-ACP methyl ester carboxylesterase